MGNAVACSCVYFLFDPQYVRDATNKLFIKILDVRVADWRLFVRASFW